MQQMYANGLNKREVFDRILLIQEIWVVLKKCVVSFQGF